MITKDLFKERILYLELNFNVKCEPAYIKFIYQSATDKFSDDDVRYGFTEIFKMTKKEWNDLYGYGGKPAVADWINFFSLRKKHEVLSLKDKELFVALTNAKNGISTRKAIEYNDSVSKEDIKELINNIGSYED
jgi:hypothetical protein